MKRLLSFFLALTLIFSTGLLAFAEGELDVSYYMSEESQDIFIGKTYTRSIRTYPEGADLSSVVWTSSNTSVATVNKSGVVTAKKSGSSTITASIDGESFKYKVRVLNPFLSSKSEKIYLGSTCRLTVRGGSGKIKWKSSDKKVATVSSKGVVTAKKVGKATITAVRNGIKMQCTVTVKKPALSKTSANLLLGKKLRLSVNGGTGNVKWTSSNKKVATVTSKGVVKTKKSGKTTITAVKNGYKLTCTVRVYDLSLNKTKVILEAGKKTTLQVNGGSGKVKWTSSDPKIASVSSSGVVTAKKVGKVSITAVKNKIKLVSSIQVKDTPFTVPKGKENIVSTYCDAVNKAKATKNFQIKVQTGPTYELVRFSDSKAEIIAQLWLGILYPRNGRERNYTVKNGSIDGKLKPSAVIPPLFEDCDLSPKGVVSASAKQDGTGCIIQFKLTQEKAFYSGTESESTKYNKMVSKPLDLTLLKITDEKDMPRITLTFTGTTVTAVIDKWGRLTQLMVTAPQKMSANNDEINFVANIVDYDNYTFTY